MKVNITKEQADRLKKNLIFNNDDIAGASGLIQILFRNESPESVKELFNLLSGILSQSEFMIGWDVEVPEFAGTISSAQDRELE